MTTTTEHLKRLAEAATPPTETIDPVLGRLVDFKQIIRCKEFEAAANPATIKAICELIEQMAEALKYHAEQTRPISQTTEALAAYEAFQKGEGK